MFLPKELDVDRLQDVTRRLVNGRWIGRGAGKTLAYLYMMLGEEQLGDWGNRYLYVGENANLARDALRDFVQLLEDEYSLCNDGIGLEVDMNRGRLIYLGGIMFDFMGAQQFAEPHSMDGRVYNRVFFDVSDDTQCMLELHAKLIKAMDTLQAHGADFV